MTWYFRFQTSHACPATRWPFGIFHASSYLYEIEEYQDVYADWLEEAFGWFNANLRVPTRSELDHRALFCFRPEARECVAAAWSIVAAYRDAGIDVRLRRSDCPGRVIYRDAHQIAAIPYWPYGRGPPVRGEASSLTPQAFLRTFSPSIGLNQKPNCSSGLHQHLSEVCRKAPMSRHHFVGRFYNTRSSFKNAGERGCRRLREIVKYSARPGPSKGMFCCAANVGGGSRVPQRGFAL